jgi:hypothetical protein
VRCRRAHWVLDDGVVSIQREPSFFIVLSGDLGRGFGCPKEGVPVR